MKLTIEGNPDEIKSVLKNLSATDDSQEISKIINNKLKATINECCKDVLN